MENLRLHKAILLVLLCVLPLVVCGERVTVNNVTMTYEPCADGSIKVLKFENGTSVNVDFSIDGEKFTVLAGGGYRPEKIAKKIVRYGSPKGGDTLWKYSEPQVADEPTTDTSAPAEVNEKKKPAAVSSVETQQKNKKSDQTTTIKSDKSDSGDNSTGDTLPDSYLDRLNNHPYFGIEAVSGYTVKADNYVHDLSQADDKQQYITDNGIMLFLFRSIEEINAKRMEIPMIVQEIVATAHETSTTNQATITQYVIETLNNRLRTREAAYNNLNNAVQEALNNDSDKVFNLSRNKIINYVIIVIGLGLIIWAIIALSRRRNNQNSPSAKETKSSNNPAVNSDGTPAIVVRRRTTSILRKQCLDDVIENPAYLCINTVDFSPNSAIRRIYIKNTCIREIYNMYAEDLRDSNKLKEDGCMVLGRWVLDREAGTYDISMEYVVMPGDDAVFKEYELNFGGKTRMRVWQQLRKLQTTTNLQYDLTCWVHSHPGMGVFFSNFDSNTHELLKHNQHPHFLTAFVVDILTPQQDIGIFTYRSDGTLNSKNDLTQLYSLEQMHKWAVESERRTFVPENFFNLLSNAAEKSEQCRGIEFNNNAIIDLMQITVDENSGLMGWATGYLYKDTLGNEAVVTAITKNGEEPLGEVIGCLFILTYLSLPTVQRLIVEESAKIKFVLIYSTRTKSLTSIPVINGEISTDEKFYGETNIDDLTIWTRRKR